MPKVKVNILMSVDITVCCLYIIHILLKEGFRRESKNFLLEKAIRVFSSSLTIFFYLWLTFFAILNNAMKI